MENALSFDIEEACMSTNLEETLSRSSWPTLEGRVVADARRALEALTRHGQRATFFIVGWAERHPDLVRAIDSAGHETAAHIFWHRLVYSISPADFREDILRVHFLSRYDVPDAPHVSYRHANGLVEFPLSVARFGNQLVQFATEAYFRLLPYTVTTWLMRRSNAAGVPVTVNIHPRELDPDQLPVPMPFKYRWRHYTNLRRTAPRPDSLLSTYRFRTLREGLEDVPPAAARSAA